MPNLVGVHDPSASAEELGRVIDRMIAAVDLPSFHFPQRRVVSPGIACGNVLPGIEDNLSQPVRDPSRGLWLLLDGEILNVRELGAALAQAGHSVVGKDDAELALLAFLAFGPDFYQRLNGTWNLVLHDEGAGQSQLITDRYGSRLLYAAVDGPRFCFANEMKGVIAGRPGPTLPGGVGFLSLLFGGTLHGDITWTEGIRLLAPGTVHTLSGQGIKRRRYFQMRFNEGGPEQSQADYAAAFAESLATATERSMKLSDRHPLAITLSGGLDSRAVALSIAPRHLPMLAITYGDEQSADVRYARQLAQVIGLEHHYIEEEFPSLLAQSRSAARRLDPSLADAGFFAAQFDRVIWRSEGLNAFDSVSSMIWHPSYRRRMRFMLNGAVGDAMTGSHLRPGLMLSPPRQEVIRRLYQGHFFQPAELVQSVVNPRFYARYAGAREPAFARDFAGIDADQAAAVASVWDMENRQRRGSFASFTMERYFCSCRSPFLDYELVDLLAGVPSHWRFQQQIYKRMLVKHHPRAAQVPWAYTQGRITASPSYELARETFNFLVARAKARLPARLRPRSRWAFRDNVGMMRGENSFAARLLAFTRSDYFPSDLLDAAGVRRLVEDFRRDGDPLRQVLYTHLLGMEATIRYFLSGDIRVPPLADPAEFGVDP